MIKTDATCVVNGVRMMTIAINTLPHGGSDGRDAYSMMASYALCAAREDDPLVLHHGKVESGTEHWSDSTRKLLEELVMSMEKDMLKQHFNVEEEDADDDSVSNEESIDQI